MDQPGCFPHLVHGGVGAAVADIVRDGAGEQVGGLEHVPKAALKPELRPGPVVLAVDVDGPRRGLVEPADQVDDGALARAGLAHQGDGLARLDVQIEVREHGLLRVVGKAHMLEADAARDALPVLPPGLDDVAVLLHHFRGVHHLDRRVDKTDDPLRRGLSALEVGEDGGELLDGVEEAGRVGDEGHQGTGRDLADEGVLGVQDALTAQIQSETGADGPQGDDQREERRVDQGRFDGGLAHAPGDLPELLGVLLLIDQRLSGHRSHDALVEGAGDAAVVLSRFPLVLEDRPLQKEGDDGQRRHHRQHQQRQLPVLDEHDDEAQERVAGGPEQVHHAPGHHLGEAAHVADHPGHEIPHGGLVVVGEGLVLELQKPVLPDVVGDGHLHLPAAGDEPQSAEALAEGEGHVRDEEQPHAVALAGDDELVHGVVGEEGVEGVRQRHEEEARDGHDEDLLIAPGVGVEPLPQLGVHPCVGEILFFLIAHAASPPFGRASWISAMRR